MQLTTLLPLLLPGVLFASALALPTSSANVYPVEPSPLRALCEQADLIVLAQVTQVEAQGQWFLDVAHLTVSATLKGPKHATVEALYEGNVICPTPPDFPTGTTVLAFLWTWDEETSGASTSAPRYGVSVIESGSRPQDVVRRTVIAKQVRSWSALQKLPVERRLPAETEWLVALVEQPDTRWDGITDLSTPGSVHAARLDRAQLGRLIQVVADSQPLVTDPHWWSTRQVMLLVAQHLGDSSLKKLAQEDRRRRILIDAFVNEATRLLTLSEG